MKIEIDEKERQRLLDEVIKDLKSDDSRWKGFRNNPIQDAFQKEMTKKLKVIMIELLDNEEFTEKLTQLGKEYLRKFLKSNIESIVSKLL